MICVLCALLAAAADFDSALRLSAQDRFVAALEAAAREPDPLRRAQAIVWVRHYAGDLDGALAAGLEARAAGVDDAWLQDRRAYVALSLRRADEARGAVADLERSVLDPALDPASRERWSASLAGYRAELDALDETLQARAAGLRRARALDLASAALVAGGIGLLALRAGRARPST